VGRTAINLTGQEFGRLRVMARAGSRNTKALWLCQCECGNVTKVYGHHLRLGETKSCGCLARTESGNRLTARLTVHGHCKSSPSRTYNSWRGMVNRCYREITTGYEWYGGLGVTVCERWHTFENFLADMGERPAGLTLDRYPNPAGNYEPGNCRWATPAQQESNKRKAR